MSDRREQAAAADRRARESAVRVWDRPLLVEAGAGSGKTAVLVARIVAWVTGPGWEQASRERGGHGVDAAAIATRCLEGVVAMTFTEAAAAEMAERTRAALALVQQGVAPLGLEGLDPHASDRAVALLGQCHRLQATTIHAFSGRLLREHALEVGLHPAWSIDADGSRWRAMVEQACRESLGGLWDAGVPSIRVLAAAGLGPAEIAQAVFALANEGVSAGWVEEQANATSEDVVEAVAAAFDAVVAVGRRPLARADRRLKKRLELAGALLFRLADVAARLRQDPSTAAATVAVLEPNLVRRLDAWAKGRLSGAEAEVFVGFEAQVATAAAAARRLVRHLRRCDLVRFAAAATAAARVLAHAEAQAQRAGVVRFADLVPLARRLLAGRPRSHAGPAGHLRQLLVDEVQDTDHEQLELVTALALSGPVEGRPGLFLVGDPKQSIYGWRSADLAAYDELGERVVTAGGERLRLVANFRSVPPILEAVERWIGPVMRREPGVQPSFEPLLPRRDSGGDESCRVERWRLDPGLRSATATEVEADAIARDLAAALARGMAPESAAILLRTTTDLPTYLRALRQHAVPYAVARERDWRRRREVVEAAAVLRMVLDPDDLVALVAVLRSPLVALPDRLLGPLWDVEFPRAFAGLASAGAGSLAEVIALLPPDDSTASSGWRGALLALGDAVAELRRELEIRSSDDWVGLVRERLALETLEAGRPLGDWRCEALERLFEWVRQRLSSGLSPFELAAALRSAAGAVGDDDVSVEPNLVAGAVRVLTVHAAKGLDFDQVYVAQVHKEPATRLRGRATRVLADERGRRHLIIAGWAAPDAWRGEEAARRVAAAEQVRLLYVALTRARERLVVAGRSAAAPRPEPLSFADLLAGDAAEAGRSDRLIGVVPVEPGETTAQAEIELRPVPGIPRERLEAARMWQRLPFVATPSTADDEVAGAAGSEDPEHARVVGRIVHRALELVDLSLLEADVELALLQLVERLSAHEDPAVGRSAAAVVRAFAAGPLWRRWLELRGRVVARELGFVAPPETGLAAGAVIGVLDCVLAPAAARDPQWVVIDYKTDRLDPQESASAHAERYRQQGDAYAAALATGLGASTPRVEWWFLRAGVAIELSPRSRSR